MATYNASGIRYTRINANNTTLATSNDGAGDGVSLTITDEIKSPTKSAQITFVSVVAGLVTGSIVSGTGFANTDYFNVDDYLYYYDGSNNPILIGQIASIDVGGAQLQLTSTTSASTPTVGSLMGASYTLITDSEPFYIRIPTKVVSVDNTKQIPNLNTWRVTPSLRNSSKVLQVASRIDRYSTVGNPIVIGTTAGVDFAIQSMNTFTPTTGGTGGFWDNGSQLPQYIWLKATPLTTAASTSALSPQTMYKLSTQEFQESVITITAGTNDTVLYDAGYNVVINTGAVVVPTA